MPSQYGEDVKIRELLAPIYEIDVTHHNGPFDRNPPLFIDVGAFDGVTFSNTRWMADEGWEGILVEPSPPAFVHLMKNYEGYSNVKLVNAAIGPRAGVTRFLANTADCLSADMLSTTKDDHAAKFAGHPFKEIYVPVIEWEEIERLCGRLPTFVNIDVEGMNLDVLKAMPFTLQAAVICVEADPVEAIGDMVAFMQDVKGMNGFWCVGGNLIAWRSERLVPRRA